MSGIKRLIFDGVAATLRYKKEAFNESVINLDKYSKPKLHEVLFRDKSLSLLEVIGDHHCHTKKASILNEITIMTYNIRGRFSNDVIEIIRRVDENALITIVFNSGKATADIIGSFEKIFQVAKKIKINVISNPSTHIKLLQLNDALYAGSMNFSSTADSVDRSKNHPDSYFNHELIFHFDEGGRAITRGIIEKLKELDDSKCFSISQENYVKEIDRHLNDKIRAKEFTSVKGDKIRKRKLSIRKKYEEMNSFIRPLIEEVVRNEVVVNFGLEVHSTFNESLLEYEEAARIINYFKSDNNVVEFVESLIEVAFRGAVEGSSNEEDAKDNIKEELVDILTSNNIPLGDLETNEDVIRETILSERLDYDNGEGVEGLFGERSEEKLEEMIEYNKKAAYEFLDSLITELSQKIYEDGFFSFNFFQKKMLVDS